MIAKATRWESFWMLKYVFAAVMCAAMAVSAGPARAEVLRYTATLGGDRPPTVTGSAATGEAQFSVDTAARTVDFTLNVHGMTLDNLFDHVIHAGVGPVHLHLYAENGDISLLIPFPYGPNYAATTDGFSLTVSDYPYADGAAVLGLETPFEAFVASLGGDFVYVNIHTDTFNDGEISGRLMPAG